jgi:hypothetical protein
MYEIYSRHIGALFVGEKLMAVKNHLHAHISRVGRIREKRVWEALVIARHLFCSSIPYFYF